MLQKSIRLPDWGGPSHTGFSAEKANFWGPGSRLSFLSLLPFEMLLGAWNSFVCVFSSIACATLWFVFVVVSHLMGVSAGKFLDCRKMGVQRNLKFCPSAGGLAFSADVVHLQGLEGMRESVAFNSRAVSLLQDRWEHPGYCWCCVGWWLWRLFWWFLCFAVPWFRLFCVACSSIIQDLPHWVLVTLMLYSRFLMCQMLQTDCPWTYTAAWRKKDGKLSFFSLAFMMLSERGHAWPLLQLLNCT